jgi:hypothetical protein
MPMRWRASYRIPVRLARYSRRPARRRRRGRKTFGMFRQDGRRRRSAGRGFRRRATG